jgi:hypothetical protein
MEGRKSDAREKGGLNGRRLAFFKLSFSKGDFSILLSLLLWSVARRTDLLLNSLANASVCTSCAWLTDRQKMEQSSACRSRLPR